MYAIIAEDGRQFRVEEGQEIDIDLRDASVGDQVKFEQVLACRDGDEFKIGQPTLDGASVTAEVLSITQGPKVTIQKARRRKKLSPQDRPSPTLHPRPHRQDRVELRVRLVNRSPLPLGEGQGEG